MIPLQRFYCVIYPLVDYTISQILASLTNMWHISSKPREHSSIKHKCSTIGNI